MPLIYPVILSGGSGTRLWPLSRAMHPKQFIKFFGSDGRSMLSESLLRLTGESFAPPTILCSNNHRFLVREALEENGLSEHTIVLEPVARNTAPAIALAALHAAIKDPNAIVAVMPSDHMIGKPDVFKTTVEYAASIAQTRRLVLFGMVPNEPHTGYGYIKKGPALSDQHNSVFEVAKFVEKPDRKTAQDYLESKDYLWNGGIFVLHVQTFLDELKVLAPEIMEAAKSSLDLAEQDLGFVRVNEEAFGKAPNISIDYAVMEKTSKAAVIPVDMDWNDIGSWNSLWKLSPQDETGNVCGEKDILIDTKNTFVWSKKNAVATIGVDDLVVVNTPDALLVAKQDRSQDVGEVVNVLRSMGRSEHEQHVYNYRPWGHFETLVTSERFQVKRLHVKPGGKLSMQKHYHRSEHWVVVQGTALVTVGDQEKLVSENESVYITATEWHRLENPGKVPLEIIEVQIGTYLGEDDIIRSNDIYNRAPDETK